MIQQIASSENIQEAFAHVKNRARDVDQGAGVDNITVAMFAKRYTLYATQIQRDLLSMAYEPSPVRQFPVDKATGLPVRIPIIEASERDDCRILGIPTVFDRVVSTAILSIIEPIFEVLFEDSVHGFRPTRGQITALNRICSFLKQGIINIFETDIESCFPRIQHRLLLEKVSATTSDPDLIELIRRIIRAPIDTCPNEPNICGLHQGGNISPFLCNVYLTDYDRTMAAAGLKNIRYADDIICFCHTKEEAKQAEALSEKTLAPLGMNHKAKKTNQVSAYEGFVFLGYDIKLIDGVTIMIKASEKAIVKLNFKIDEALKESSSSSARDCVEAVKNVVSGWLGHYGAINDSGQIRDINEQISLSIKRGMSRYNYSAVERGDVAVPNIARMIAAIKYRRKLSSFHQE